MFVTVQFEAEAVHHTYILLSRWVRKLKVLVGNEQTKACCQHRPGRGVIISGCLLLPWQCPILFKNNLHIFMAQSPHF